MDTALNDFVRVLREHHVRVSPAETVDALRAVSLVGLHDRRTVRDALRAALVKDPDDLETFERLFGLFFSLSDTAPAAPSAHLHGHGHGHEAETEPARLQIGEDAEGEEDDTADHLQNEEDPTDLRRYFDDEHMSPSQSMHQDPDRMRLSMLSQQLILNRDQGPLQNALQRLSHQMRVRRVHGMFHPGGLATGAGGQEELPMDITAVELRNLVDHLHDLGIDDGLLAEIEARSEDILEGLPELIERILARRAALESPAEDATAGDRAMRKLTDFSPAEQQEMEAVVRRLARQIHGAHTRRLRRDRRGNISVGHTLRSNIRYEGIPFQPVLRRHREHKPRLVLLCDISLSTRNLARFWLHLIHRTQNQFAKVRTFVFVADTVEVTQLLEERTIDDAVDAVFGGKVIDADVNSDFGAAIERFRTDHLPTVNRRTTVVVLGDGRNNGNDPNVAALEEVAHYARRTIWITPEPEWGWPMGGCDMDLYEPVCDEVEVVRTVEELGNVAEGLTRIRT